MGYGSVEFREVGSRPIYDDEFSFDHRGGFGATITDMLRKVTTLQVTPPTIPVAPMAPATGVSPGSTTIGVAPIPLPPPIRVAPALPPVSAQTTVGPPLTPTASQTPVVVVTGTDGGGTTVAKDAGGGDRAGLTLDNPLVIGGLVALGLLALRRSGGTRRY